MFRLWLMVPLLVVGIFWTSFLTGDDKKPAKESAKRLPPYYGKLKLSPKQKLEIYKILDKYQAEIQELQQKLEELKDQEKADCQSVLTPDQLAQLRRILLGSDRKKNMDAKDAGAKNKLKDAVAKDKKKDKEAKGKKDPVEIKK